MAIFTKARIAERDELVKKLLEKQAEVATQTTAYNTVVEEYNTAVQELNEVLLDVREFRDDIVSEIEDYIENKSEKWQEGDTGEAWGSWKGEWEGLDLDDVEEVDEMKEPDLNFSEELENLDTSPST